MLQAVFSIIQPGVVDPGASPATPGINGTPQSTSTPANPSSTSLPQIILMLLSLAAVRDWIKLLILGSLLEVARRGLMKGWERLIDSIWVVATFEFSDDAAGASILGCLGGGQLTLAASRLVDVLVVQEESVP